MKRAILALLSVQVLSFALTLWASLNIALGANPESLQSLDALAPLFALLLVAFWFGRRGSYRAGVLVALPNIAFWVLMHVFVSTRFEFEFWRDGFTQLSFAHLSWWMLAVLVTLAGAFAGAKMKSKAALFASLPLALLLVSGAQLLTPRDKEALYESDGTSVRVFSFDLQKVDFGLDDADCADAKPFDNRNTTWLSRAMPRVWSSIAASEKQEPLCVVNGGFFGATSPLLAQHEAPLRSQGRSLYDVQTLQNDWPKQNATLVWKRDNGRTEPQIIGGASFNELRSFEGALGGVRVLICNGQSQILNPGMGGTTLKCSRTSLAWNTNQFWVLSVRDPDGEASACALTKLKK